MIESDCLVLLSDVDGLYTAPPGKDPAATHLPVVPAITAEIEAMAGGAASHLSRGGMTTKILALTDALGNLVRFELLPGHRFDTVGVPPLIDGVAFGALIADKAFDSNAIVADLDARGAKVVISQHPRRSTPLATRSAVLFPAPFGPTSPTTSPAATCTDMSCSTSRAPRRTDTWSRDSNGLTTCRPAAACASGTGRTARPRAP